SKMGQVAVEAARAAGYSNAGTVEFLVDQDMSFYFMEMNTRLQVEHPVTELITGVDLVREQLEIAAGKPLGLSQEDIKARGHAIECRIYAEDPENDFMPSPGRIKRLHEPLGPGVRVDSYAYSGCEIPIYYDPLVSKLITWGSDRSQAIRRMERALEEYSVVGIATTIPFHAAVMRLPAFAKGETDTGFIEKHRLSFMGREESSEGLELAAVAAALTEHMKKTGIRVDHGPFEPRSRWKDSGRLEQLNARLL
ncbi:acetyl-CoA carboxylase biotin carboxylase subunit, partial [Acidobacteriota bacterium]